ncbi:MAG TPA: hypothetical protein VGK96_02395 [Candidatus Sulfotelmatobacter sp.]|jgi:hypothetical protein
MKTIKFVVKVNRGGSRAPTYVQRVDKTPIHMTTNRKLALVMGRFTAEDAIKSLQNSHCIPELESVQVRASVRAQIGSDSVIEDQPTLLGSTAE